MATSAWRQRAFPIYRLKCQKKNGPILFVFGRDTQKIAKQVEISIQFSSAGNFNRIAFLPMLKSRFQPQDFTISISFLLTSHISAAKSRFQPRDFTISISRNHIFQRQGHDFNRKIFFFEITSKCISKTRNLI